MIMVTVMSLVAARLWGEWFMIIIATHFHSNPTIVFSVALLMSLAAILVLHYLFSVPPKGKEEGYIGM